MLHLLFFCVLLDLLLSKLEINFMTLRKKNENLIAHLLACLVIFIAYLMINGNTTWKINKKNNNYINFESFY